MVVVVGRKGGGGGGIDGGVGVPNEFRLSTPSFLHLESPPYHPLPSQINPRSINSLLLVNRINQRRWKSLTLHLQIKNSSYE